MNNIFKALFYILFITFPLASYSQIILKVNNISVLEGQLICGLYNEPDVFLEEGEEAHVSTTKVNSTIMIVRVDSLAAGTYAYSIFHDKNFNGEIEKNFFGIPKEPYGFSNNYKPVFRAPKFSECSFDYDGEYIEIEIILLD